MTSRAALNRSARCCSPARARYARDVMEKTIKIHSASGDVVMCKGCWADHERLQARADDAERQSEAPAAPGVWVAAHSPEWRAWLNAKGIKITTTRRQGRLALRVEMAARPRRRRRRLGVARRCCDRSRASGDSRRGRRRWVVVKFSKINKVLQSGTPKARDFAAIFF